MVSPEEFEKIVSDCLDELPVEMMEPLDNIIFLIEERPEDGSETLGVYEGFSLSERGMYGFAEEPDRIILFRENLVDRSDDLDDLKHEIYVTLVHEIAHFLGFDEEKVHELGWG